MIKTEIKPKDERHELAIRISKGTGRHISDVKWYLDVEVGQFKGHKRRLKKFFNHVIRAAQRSRIQNQVDLNYAGLVLQKNIKPESVLSNIQAVLQSRDKNYHVANTIPRSRIKDRNEFSEHVMFDEAIRIVSSHRRKGWREIEDDLLMKSKTKREYIKADDEDYEEPKD